LSWILNVEIHLEAINLRGIIKEEYGTSLQDRAKAKVMIFIRHHLQEGLIVLWQNLKEIYDHQKFTILPQSCYDWLQLRLQDFKLVSEYNSVFFLITSQLKLCGKNIKEDQMLKKTFSTFHASNIVLQQQYREYNIKGYSELISCLLVSEQNNEHLIKKSSIISHKF
jgi:hypothetical protein